MLPNKVNVPTIGWGSYFFLLLYHITRDRSNECILVIFGHGHAYLLRQLVQESPDFEVVEVGDYLHKKE